MTSAAASNTKASEFHNCFVITSQLQDILSDFDQLRANAQQGGEQPCMLLTGDTGTGKSCLINYYYQKEIERAKSDRRVNPILLSRIPSHVTLRDTLIQLLMDLEMFSAEYRLKNARATDMGITEFLITSLKKQKIEIIFINEFQELIEFKSISERQEIANRLKQISEYAQVPIVIVGMPWAEDIAKEPQWSSRLFYRRYLNYFKISNESDRERYAIFLKELSKFLPFIHRPELEIKEIAFPLFSICKGEIRRLKFFLVNTMNIALSENSNNLSKKHMSLAHQLIFPDRENPFEINLPEIKISEIKTNSSYIKDEPHKRYKLVEPTFTKSLPLYEILKKGQ